MMNGEWNTRMESTMNLTGKNKMINKPLLLLMLKNLMHL